MILGHKSILSKLNKQKDYSDHVNEIMATKKYKPREGKLTDAAHPAIHPTGNKPSDTLPSDEKKLYDLIVKRYLSLFGKRAEFLQRTIKIDVNGHKFDVKGRKILDEGWVKYYKPYYSLSESILPDVELNKEVRFNFIDSQEHFTSPPTRFNESSLLKYMEDEKIGTKATRAGIIQRLFDRGYMEGKEINPTPLGVAVVNVLQEQYPILVKSEMTRNLEQIMDDVQNGTKDIQNTVFAVKKELKELLDLFHQKETEIGLALYKNLQLTEKSDIIVLGECQQCKKGELRIIRSKKTGKRFVACSSYFDKSIGCNATYPIPNTGTIKPTKKVCIHDNLPIIEWQRGRKKITMCISPDCPSKKEGEKGGSK